MRTFLWLLSILLLSATLTAQQRQVRVEMKSGKIFTAQIKDVTEEMVLLIVPEGELRVPTGAIAKIVELAATKTGTGSSRSTPLKGGDPEVGQPGWSLEEIGQESSAETTNGQSNPVDQAQTPAPAPGVESQIHPPSSSVAGTGGADARVASLVDRFLWIVPQSSGNRISLGASIFIMLVFLIQLCTRMANLEGRSMGRSGAMAAFLFLILAIELSLTPPELPFLVGVVVLDVMVWYLLVHLFYKAGAYGSTVMLLSFLLASLLAVLSLEMIGFVLQEGALH